MEPVLSWFACVKDGRSVHGASLPPSDAKQVEAVAGKGSNKLPQHPFNRASSWMRRPGGAGSYAGSRAAVSFFDRVVGGHGVGHVLCYLRESWTAWPQGTTATWHARRRSLKGMSRFLKPGLGLLEEKLFPLQHLVFPFEEMLFPLEQVLFPLEHPLFPFEPEFSGLKGRLSGLQRPRDGFKLLRPGMKPEAFRLQPEEHRLEPPSLGLQQPRFGPLHPPRPKEDRRCPGAGIVPRRSPAAIRMESRPKLGYHALERADKLAGGRESPAEGDAFCHVFG